MTVVPSTLHCVVIPEVQKPQNAIVVRPPPRAENPIVLPAPQRPQYPSRVSVNKQYSHSIYL